MELLSLAVAVRLKVVDASFATVGGISDATRGERRLIQHVVVAVLQVSADSVESVERGVRVTVTCRSASSHLPRSLRSDGRCRLRSKLPGVLRSPSVGVLRRDYNLPLGLSWYPSRVAATVTTSTVAKGPHLAW